MATHHINFTKEILEKIAPPSAQIGKVKTGGKYDTYKDKKEKSLVLLVSNGGAKTYYLYAKVKGRPERIKLGAFTDLSVEAARKKAAKCRGEIADGKNPQDDKRAFRQEATFEELFKEYLERYSKKHKKSWVYDEREINKFLPHWFKRKISSITTHEVQKLHEGVGDKNGHIQANRLLERIRAIYNKAIEWGWKGSNPAIGIKKFKEKSRDRFLQAHEIGPFLDALDAEMNQTVKDYFLLSLLMAARKSNMLSMRWDQIDFEHKRWRIPDTKNDEPVVLPLSSVAMNILNRRRANICKVAWVFPSETSAAGHLKEPKRAWQRLKKRIEIFQLIDLFATYEGWDEALIEEAKETSERNLAISFEKYRKRADALKLDRSHLGFLDIRIHDLRRTMGSWQAHLGTSLAIIGKSLGHKSQKATEIYARLSIDPVRSSVEQATEAMLSSRHKKILLKT